MNDTYNGVVNGGEEWIKCYEKSVIMGFVTERGSRQKRFGTLDSDVKVGNVLNHDLCLHFERNVSHRSLKKDHSPPSDLAKTISFCKNDMRSLDAAFYEHIREFFTKLQYFSLHYNYKLTEIYS